MNKTSISRTEDLYVSTQNIPLSRLDLSEALREIADIAEGIAFISESAIERRRCVPRGSGLAHLVAGGARHIVTLSSGIYPKLE